MSALRSAFNSLSGTIVNLLIGLVGIIVLARLIPVEDHGIYALSYAIYLLFQPFLDFGLTPVYIKIASVTNSTNSVFFFMNIFIGVGIAAVMMTSSPFIADFFGHNVLIWLLCIQAISVVLLSAGNQPISQLFRNKQFLSAESVRNVSALLSLLIAIYLAIIGWGIWALAAKFLLNALFRLLAVLWLVKPTYRWINFSLLKEYTSSIKFGGFITASRILAGYTNNLDKLIIGKMFGESALGHYEKATVIVDKPNNLRNALTTPAFAHLARMSKSRYTENYYLIAYLFGFFAGCPALFFCCLVKS